MISSGPDGAGGLEVCIARRTVRYAGRETRLPDLSFRLLHLLGERAPEPVSFAEIEQGVWGAQVSRETIKQRVKMLRDSLAALGLQGGVDSTRSVGYRLTRQLGIYESGVPAESWRRARRLWLAAAGVGAAACAGFLALYVVHGAGDGAARPMTISVSSESVPAPDSMPAWDGARRLLVRDLSRLSGLVVVASDASGPATDLVVEMERLPLNGHEILALELVETASGVVLWAEIYPLNEGSWDRAVSHFVADIHAQIEGLGLQLGRDGFPQQPRQVQALYLEASSLARTDEEADLMAARARLESALERRPTFALARALRASIDARLVMAHGHDPASAHRALAEARMLVEAYPEVPEFRHALSTTQLATGDLPGALRNLEIAQRDMPFLRRDVLALQRRIELARGQSLAG